MTVSSRLTRFPASTLDTTLSSLSSNPEHPLPIIPVGVAGVVDKQIDERNPRLERWTVTSFAMQRHVSVQIMRRCSTCSTASPPPNNSGWIGGGRIGKVFTAENVALIIPTQAAGMDHQVVNYKGAGVQAWSNVREELAPACTDPA